MTTVDRDILIRQLRDAVAENPANREIIAAHAEYLRDSEDKLLSFMRGEQPSPDSPGDVDFGGILHQLNAPATRLAAEASGIGDLYTELGIPPSRLLATPFAAESVGPIVTNDGSLIGTGKWQALDPDWLEAFGNYILLKLGRIKKHPFPVKPKSERMPNRPVRIALVGDWGTGEWKDGTTPGPAIAVMQQVAKLDPDYTIHLGDVYYSGTRDEEKSRFISAWTPARVGAFMLNSNHEMYDGANGYFDVGLGSGAFSIQQNTSYFAIANDDVVILGLDSAYYDSSLLFMKGSLPASGHQATFVRDAIGDRKTIIALTHHNGFNFDGTSRTSLWNDMGALLNGRQPDFWYWGHLHNGIVYADFNDHGRRLRARCAGHGAIPFAKARSLATAATVKYYSQTPNPQAPPRVMNGFAMLEIEGPNIKETFYDQSGAVAWSS